MYQYKDFFDDQGWIIDQWGNYHNPIDDDRRYIYRPSDLNHYLTIVGVACVPYHIFQNYFLTT